MDAVRQSADKDSREIYNAQAERGRLFARGRLWFAQSEANSRKYHAQFRKMMKYLSNKQIKDEDNLRRGQDDTHIQFNKLAPLIAAITGTLINNQRDIAFKARAYANAEKVNLAAEMVNNAASWIRDAAHGERGEVSAFRDAIVAGIGYLEIGVDYAARKQGRYVIKRLDPQSIIFDSRAREPNLTDARFLFRVSKLSLGEAMQLFPHAAADALNAGWANAPMAKRANYAGSRQFDDEALRRAFPESAALLGKTGSGLCLQDTEQDIVLVEMLWREMADIYRSKDGHEFTIYDFTQMETALRETPNLAPVRRQEMSFRAFLGGSGLLDEPVQPLCPAGQLPILPVSCYFDEYGERYYGLMEAGLDAQTAINKLYANYMFALDFSSKGGYIVQKDAIGNQESIKQFEQTIAKPEKVTLVDDLKGIMAKPVGNIPKDMLELLAIADRAIYDCTGLSKEYLGMTDREQANVLELTRRQSTLNVLSEPFEHTRYLRLDLGRILLWLIKNTLPNETLMGVNGALGANIGHAGYKALKFDKPLVEAFDYDVIIDDMPASIDERTRTYELLKDLSPLIQPLIDQGALETAKIVIDNAPLPASVAQRLMAAIEADRQAAANQAAAMTANAAPPAGAAPMNEGRSPE